MEAKQIDDPDRDTRNGNFKYWAFISYSHQDIKSPHWYGLSWGKWLHRKIETYTIPRKLVGRSTRSLTVPKRLYPVFLDEEELPTSAELSDSIKEALRQSQSLIVICSPKASQSQWVNEEIRLFKQLPHGSRVLAVIVDGEPNASNKPDLGLEECFPEALRYEIGPSGKITTRRVEPVAADVRAGGSSKRYAKLKVIAGILGIEFNELNRRDIRRRRRKRLSLATVGIILMGLLIGLFATTEALTDRLQVIQSLLEKERNLPFSRRAGAYSQQELEMIRHNLERREMLVERLQNRFDVGVGGFVDLLSAKADLNYSQAEIAWANGNRQEALALLEVAAKHAEGAVRGANVKFEEALLEYEDVHKYEIQKTEIDLALQRLRQILERDR